MPPAFQTPNSATRNCGQLGSSSATRSPLRTPMATSAAPKASLSASRRWYDTVAPLKSSAGLSPCSRGQRPQVVEQRLVRVGLERRPDVRVVVREPGLHGGHSRSGRSGGSGRSGRQVTLVGAHGAASGTSVADPLGMALSHHTLVAWQRADDLFIKIHVLCAHVSRHRAVRALVADAESGLFSRGQHRRRSLEAQHRQATGCTSCTCAEASLAELGYCAARVLEGWATSRMQAFGRAGN